MPDKRKLIPLNRRRGHGLHESMHSSNALKNRRVKIPELRPQRKRLAGDNSQYQNSIRMPVCRALWANSESGATLHGKDDSNGFAELHGNQPMGSGPPIFLNLRAISAFSDESLLQRWEIAPISILPMKNSPGTG